MEKKLQECLNTLDGSFDRLQELEIKTTLTNMEKLTQVLYDIRGVFMTLLEMKDKLGGEQDGGSAADPDGRDDH